MAYEIYDLKGILFLVFAIPMIASTNIDCSGKAFHCVNSTHFMICVDLGSGISTTIDDFVIPCPPTTVCHEENIFECEFPKTQVTTPLIPVIGVSKQSVIRATTVDTYSVTVPTPPDKSLLVLNVNTIVTTVSTPEEVIPIKKLDVQENLNQPNKNITEISANKIINDKQTINNTNRKTSVNDNNLLDSAMQISTDKAVTTNKSESIDTVTSATSVIKLKELIPNDFERLANTSNISYNNTTLVELLTTKRPIKNFDTNTTVPIEMNSTSMVNIHIWNGSDGIKTTNNINQITENGSIGEIFTTETVVIKGNDFMLEPLEAAPIDKTTTEKNFELLGFETTTEKNSELLRFADFFFDDNAASPTTISNAFTFLNTSHNTTATAGQYTSTQTIINGDQVQNVSSVESDILNEINTTTVANTYLQNINKDNDNNSNNELFHQNFVGLIPIGNVTGIEPDRTAKNKYLDKIEKSVLAPETAATGPQTTINTIIKNDFTTVTLNNDSFIENESDARPLEIITDLSINSTNNTYQTNLESNKVFIATKNNSSGTNDTIAKIQSVYNTSSTNMFKDITTELNTFLTPTTTEIPIALNKAIAKGIEVENDVSSATTTNVNKIFLNIYTTPVPHATTLDSVTTVKGWIPQTDFFPKAPLDTVLGIIALKTSENNRSTATENSIITSQGSKNQVSFDQLDIVETVKSHGNDNISPLNTTGQGENVNKTNTVYLSDVSKQDNLNNSLNPIKTNNNQTPPPTILYSNEFTTNIPETLYTTSMDFLLKIRKHNPEVTHKIESAKNDNDETSTSLPLDATYYTNIVEEEKSYENMLRTTSPARESVTQEVNIVSTKRITDIFSSIYPENYESMANWKYSDNIESTTSEVNQNKTANKSAILKSITVKNAVKTISPSSPANTYQDESVTIMALMGTTNPSINSLSSGTLKPSSENTTSLLNSTKSSTFSDAFIKAIRQESSSFYTTVVDTIPGNKLTQITETASAKSYMLQENTQTTESLPQKSLVNLGLSISSTEPSLLTEKYTGMGKSVTNTDSSSWTLEFNQRDATTNYVTEKIMDFAFSNVGHSTKQSNLPTEETKATISVRELALDTITKTTVIPSTTYTVYPQGIKNNLEERKELSVIETQTDNYNNIKPLLPVLESTYKNNAISQVTLAPIVIIVRNTSKIITSDLPLSGIAISNYNKTTESIKSYVTTPGSTMGTSKGIGEKITETNNDAKVSFTEAIFNNQSISNSKLDDISVKHIIDNEKISMDNNNFQDNTQNTSIILKELVGINIKKENVNYTENHWLPTDANIQKSALKINLSLFEEVSSEPTISKSTDIQNKNLRTDPLLAIQIDYDDLKKADFVDYKFPVISTSPLYAMVTESKASKYLTQSKIKEAYTDKLLNNQTAVTNTKQEKVQTDSQNILTKINNTKLNLTTSYSNLSLQINTQNNSLEERFKPTNNTITTEIQSHFNKSDNQWNELESSKDSIRNSNITTRSIKFNAVSNKTITNDSEYLFDCLNHIRGKYADKKDCRKFYTCVGKLKPIIGICPNNTVFSKINKQCTRNLSHCVRNNQFRCVLEGRFSDFFLDNIYYICVKNSMNAFVRYKLQCQNGYHLNKVLVKCEKNEDIQSQSASSASENSKINNDESKLKLQIEETGRNNGTTHFECNSEGKFPYEKDCRKYYVCTNVKNIYRRKIKTCASDEVFDNRQNKCIESESSECKLM